MAQRCLLIALMVCVLSLTFVTNQQLLFNNKYTLRFPNNTLEMFYRCLCDKTKRTCRQKYTLESHVFRYVADVHGGLSWTDFDQGYNSSDEFVCHPGGFGNTGHEVVCIRGSKAFEMCTGEKRCQSFHVNLPYDTCDFKCLNINWSQFSLKLFNFGGNPKFIEGSSCEVPPKLDQCPNPSDNDKSPEAALVIGWVLFAILFGLNVAYIAYRFRIHRLNSKGSNEANSNSKTNNNIGFHTKDNSSERGERVENKQPVSIDTKASHEYEECNPNDPSDYNIIDDKNRAPAATKKVTKLDDIKAMLKRRPLPGYTNEASLIMAGAARMGRDEMSRQGTTTELNKGETSNGYTDLKAVSLSEDQQIPEDEPGLYGIDSGIREERQDSKNSNMADYAKLNSRGHGLAASVKPTDPDTYNTASSRFEERSKNGAHDMPKPMGGLYDVPSG